MLVIKENVVLAPYTIYKIGGPTRYFVEVKNAKELEEALVFSLEKKAPFFILGAGSNVLVSDAGFGGLVIRMVGGGIKTNGQKLIVDSGVMMARAVHESAKAGLTGFEWGIGVPGTVGGSVRGNAGCFGNEMKDVIENVAVYDSSKHATHNLSCATCDFSYRDSIFKRHSKWIILSATLKLQKGDPKEIPQKIRKFTAERNEKQDIGTRSCGCIFKNIKWGELDKTEMLKKFPVLEQFKDRPTIPVSFLIDHAGLKNLRQGKIFVSPKHANFFINEGGGTASEVKTLIETVKEKVKQKYGLRLKEEIQYMGF